MAGSSAIEWTDMVWNPVTGCNKVSPGCTNCYAEALDKRFQKDGPFRPWAFPKSQGGRGVTLHPERLEAPLHWKKPRRVFVNSMSDLFHEDVPDAFILQIFSVMWAAKDHSFQVLTKRPDRMVRWFGAIKRSRMNGYGQILDPLDWNFVSVEWPLPNVWLGVSVESQYWADRRIPLLLQTPAAVRFVSAEPLLGGLDLREWLEPNCLAKGNAHFERTGHHVESRRYMESAYYESHCPDCNQTFTDEAGLSWTITGAESGPNRRPADPQWFRDIRDQCLAAGVPYFHKQGSSLRPGQDRLLDGVALDQTP